MDWQTIRNQFMRSIGGDPPGAHLEDELIQAYANHPEAVERSIEKIALAHKAGKIRSPWGALKTEVAKATEAARNPTHHAGTNKTKAVARAEQWMRTAGIHYDRATEIQDELFGQRGTLRTHTTPELQDRITDLWLKVRPLGEQVEAEHEAFMAKYAAQDKTRTTSGTAKPLEQLKAIAATKGADRTRL
jgi:hypothetical protein